jgi:hypothetical protein
VEESDDGVGSGNFAKGTALDGQAGRYAMRTPPTHTIYVPVGMPIMSKKTGSRAECCFDAPELINLRLITRGVSPTHYLDMS